MKKTLLLAIPALLALSACGGNNTIDEAKAEEIAKNIEAESLNVKNYEATFEMSSAMGKGDRKVESNRDYSFKTNEAGEYYLKSVDGNAQTEVYHVLNDEYEEVIYSVASSDAGVEYSVLVKKDNTLAWTLGVVGYTMMSLPITASLAIYESPYTTFFTDYELDEDDEMDKDDYNQEVVYSSKNDRSLTINAKATLKDDVEVDEDKEVTKTSDITVVYENLHFVKSTSESETTFGNKNKTELTLKVLDSLSIELPSDWESHLSE